MQSFFEDLRHAARALRNSLGFTLIAVITLGLGMAVNTTVFSVINGMLLRPLPVPHAEQITVLAMQQAGTPDFQKFSYPDFQDIAKQADAFSDLFAYRETLAGLLVNGKGDHCVLARVTGNYFTALGIKPALGRLILPAEGQIPGADPILVLGYSYWQRRFNGDRSVIGKQVQINGHPATIVGIAPQGFNPDHILNFSVDVQQSGYDETHGRAFYKQLQDRIPALPGVVSAAQAFSVPMGVYSGSDPVIAEGHPVEAGKEPPTVMYNAVTPGYFETLQMPLVGGRDFRDSDDAKAPSVAVINQVMAKKFWPDDNPIGKRFFTKAVGGKPVEIVGVVRTARYKSIIEDPPLPFFYVPLEQQDLPLRAIHLRTSVPPESLRLPVQSVFREIAPGLALTQLQTMREALDGVNGFFFFRFAVQLTGTMGLLGLILAVVGVYSVVSYAAAQRTHEIGIRMALGAIPRDILLLVLRQSLLVVAIGLAVGLLASVGATRAIAILLVGIRPTDPVTFVTVAFLLSFIALFACWIPARRATRVSPLVALRYE